MRRRFSCWDEVIEYGDTEKMFSVPTDKRTEDYITGTVWLRRDAMRKTFDQQLELLNQELIHMGALCEDCHCHAATERC